MGVEQGLRLRDIPWLYLLLLLLQLLLLLPTTVYSITSSDLWQRVAGW